MGPQDRRAELAFRAAAVLVMLLAAGLRLACLDTEFWFDEIWSREFADTAQQPWEIWLGPQHHHDNNHKLNTLILWLTPGRWPFWAQRLHSFLAGLAIVALGMMWARPMGRWAAFLAGLFLACNFWQVLHSCEARGYAMAGALALAAVLLQDGLLRRPGGWRLPTFWLVCVLGVSAHLLYTHVLLGLGVWAILETRQRRSGLVEQWRLLLRLFGVPLAACLLLYLVDVRWMVIGGPPAVDPQVIGTLLSLGWGLAEPATLRWWAALALAMLVLALGCRLVSGPQRGFLITTILVAPALTLALQPPILFERYFYISYLFWLIVQALVLARLTASGNGTECVLMIMLLYVVMSCAQAMDLRRLDRGAMRRLADHWSNPAVPTLAVTSDSDWRTSRLMDFYFRTQGILSKEVMYIPAAEAGRRRPVWILLQWPRAAAPGQQELVVAGRRYRLDAAFPVGVPANAGWGWLVYRITDEETNDDR